MRNNILDEIRESFRKGSTLTKLIYVNLAVFIFVIVLRILKTLFIPANVIPFPGQEPNFYEAIMSYLYLSSYFDKVIVRPWTIISYNFLHERFLHILFNLLWLYWFGQIFLRYLNQKQLLTTYLIGGIFGGALFLLAYNTLPGLVGTAPGVLGASASVSAIVIGISFFAPNHTIRLFFIGEVKLKHLAIAFIILDIIQIPGGNAGGHIAHLGGALYGYLFATQLKRGKDMGKGFGNFMDALVSLFRRKPKMKVAYKSQAKRMTDEEYNKEKAATQKEVDKILDKIAKSGYESLTKSEKEILFKMSNKS